MALAITLPQVLVPIGPGEVTSGLIDSTATHIVVNLQFIAWPNAKDHALDYALWYSPDSGATWRILSAGDMDDSVGSSNFAVTAGCSLQGVGSSTRKVKFIYNFAKALTIAGTVSVV